MNDDQTRAYLMGMAKFANEHGVDFTKFIKVANFMLGTNRSAQGATRAARLAPDASTPVGRNIDSTPKRKLDMEARAELQARPPLRKLPGAEYALRNSHENDLLLRSTGGAVHNRVVKDLGKEMVNRPSRRAANDANVVRGMLAGLTPPTGQRTLPSAPTSVAGSQTRVPAGLDYVNRHRQQPTAMGNLGRGLMNRGGQAAGATWRGLSSHTGRGIAGGLGVGAAGAIGMPWAVQQATTGSPAGYSGLGNVPLFSAMGAGGVPQTA